ncbi:glycosyltransferase [Clostridium sporogenes]|uniref:Glycosyltransferase n=3 Tax=Clostridium sporogenes TaxID=1509 RepID=A0A7X5P676_CLOSG|nr:glycosyltransferase [Clostridium sporogenes]AJD33048.1 glycosyl transferase 2 family protein [Clostridium botulinum Prevot_594]NFQ15402.1 glycosyltransferase [Clostridium sporogenes]NFQ19423.1 glycosyltransferase [Clostridium sporogenes]NFQ27945.1 glycosyltransferase [Clostridium sporogenes]NFR60130.1 glycosyltransferase [Clostridium sporogenes]
MNDKKICFITCVNDDRQYEECLVYINRLNVPEGYEIDVISIKEAESMTAGYNAAMKDTDAKYKVYLHQDTYIINKNFIYDMLNLFNSDEKIGMIGVAGAKTIPTNGVWWESIHKYGQVYENHTGNMELLAFNEPKSDYEEVKAIDGLIMITQYDIPWRKDVFDGWHFYDMSQSVEFTLQGYKVVVPKQDEVWCIHDCGVVNTQNGYDIYRNSFLGEYSNQIFPLVTVMITAYNRPEYFRIALNSAVKQTYRNIEILICDNSTNYECNDIAQIYMKKHNNIRYYKNKTELAVIDNFNKCIEMSNGELLCYLMDDDVYDENKISIMAKYLIEDSEISLVTSARQPIDSKGNNINDIAATMPLSNEINIVDGRILAGSIIENQINFIGETTTPLFRKKDIIKKFGFYKNNQYEVIADVATWISLFSKGKVVYLPQRLSCFRIHENQDQNRINTILKGANEWYQLINKCYSLNLIQKEQYTKALTRWLKNTKNVFDFTEKLNDYDEKLLSKLIKNYKKIKGNISNIYNINFFNFGNNSILQPGYEFLRPEGISIGNNVLIQKDSWIQIPYDNLGEIPRIIIEDRCNIGKRCVISATNKVFIEKDVIIAANAHITDHNHEYKQVGIPIMYQGVTSFTNEVVIGQGSWIANNVVIAGNVHIGRGCAIGANSVVIEDIPDYCVAVGSPAKVIKCFDRVSGEWVKVKNKNHLDQIIRKGQTSQPLVTIGVITYNRSNYLDKCLKAIFDQIGNDNLFEILISDNNSTDDTKLVVDKYKSKYSNLKYYKNKNNVGAMKNIHKALERAAGEFIVVHGDDDYLSYLSLYKLVDMIYKNRDCSVMYMLPSNEDFNIYNGIGINEYIEKVSFMSTFMSGVVLKKNDFAKIEDREKFIYTDINQVYIQLELLRNNPNFAVLTGRTLSLNSGEHKPNGYNFGEVFIKNYLDILYYFRQYGLEEDIIKNEKYKLLKSMILPWCRKIINENIELDISDIMTLFYDYYKEESYFEEVTKQLQIILKQ